MAGMNPFAGLQLQTPQQIQQRQMQERQAAWASGNPFAMQQATYSNFLDTMFGNPEQMQAKRLQQALMSADQAVVPAEGDSDIDTQIKRARAMRDAAVDLDPNVAAQLNTQLLQLGQIKLEQDKLRAEEARNVRKETREEAEEARKAALFPVEFAGKVGSVQGDMAESVNYMDPKTGTMVSVPKNDPIQQQAMRERGWVLAGKPTLQGSKEDVTGLTKPVVTDLQTNITDSAKQLDAFATIATKFRPEFLTIPTQVLQATNQGVERLTGKNISPEVAAQAQQYYDFRTQTMQALNSYIKQITGAQAAVAEYERLQKSFPNMSMGPTQFVSSLRESVKNTLGINKRAMQALSQGLRVTPEMQEQCKTVGQPCIWDSIATPPVSDAEVDAFLSRFGIPGRASAGPEKPTGSSLEDRLKKYQ